MKKNILITLLVTVPIFCNCQDKKQYILNSINHYDSVGNVFATQKTYDHIPTSEDSSVFFKESEASILQAMDSIHRANVQENNSIQARLKNKRKKTIKKKTHN